MALACPALYLFRRELVLASSPFYPSAGIWYFILLKKIILIVQCTNVVQYYVVFSGVPHLFFLLFHNNNNKYINSLVTESNLNPPLITLSCVRSKALHFCTN